MVIDACRVCGNKFLDGPLLRYENMPAAAQYLPEAGSLAGDKGVVLEVCQCAGCGLVQLSNEPVAYYREVIRATAVSPEMTAFRRQQFADFVQKYALRGKQVVEIGCGRGEYLSIMKQSGVAACGLENSAEAVAAGIKAGLKVVPGFVDKRDYRLSGAPFSAFYIMSYLEHLPEPNVALAGIANNLEEGGVGLIEVPNFDLVIRNNLFSEFIGDHLMYFTQATLTTALNLNGFEVLECREVWHDYIISAVVRKRPRLELKHFQARQAELKKEVEAFIGRYGRKQVAIWGAGHQALALISLLGLGELIKYVVDSAPFKQNKFTPATHLPIVAPEALSADPVAAVLVMAASYSDEVAATIRQKYGARISLAVLRDRGLEIG